jgi:6-phosphofructokinase 1
MAAIAGGKFAMVPIPDPKLGPRQVEIETMFNVERYRPSYINKEGLPVFLTHL